MIFDHFETHCEIVDAVDDVVAAELKRAGWRAGDPGDLHEGHVDAGAPGGVPEFESSDSGNGIPESSAHRSLGGHAWNGTAVGFVALGHHVADGVEEFDAD